MSSHARALKRCLTLSGVGVDVHYFSVEPQVLAALVKLGIFQTRLAPFEVALFSKSRKRKRRIPYELFEVLFSSSPSLTRPAPVFIGESE